MEERIRSILEQQMMMKGQRGMGYSANPWISYLKELEHKTRIPYNELMLDPEVRKLYRMENRGGVAKKKKPVARKKTNCWSKYLGLKGLSAKEAKKNEKDYIKYIKSGKCTPANSMFLNGTKRKVARKPRATKSVNCWSKYLGLKGLSAQEAKKNEKDYIKYITSGKCTPAKSMFLKKSAAVKKRAPAKKRKVNCWIKYLKENKLSPAEAKADEEGYFDYLASEKCKPKKSIYYFE
jgi:hypothetical protein